MTKKAYVWAYARSTLDGGPPGVIYDFCAGRGAQYPLAFLGGRGRRMPSRPGEARCGMVPLERIFLIPVSLRRRTAGASTNAGVIMAAQAGCRHRGGARPKVVLERKTETGSCQLLPSRAQS